MFHILAFQHSSVNSRLPLEWHAKLWQVLLCPYLLSSSDFAHSWRIYFVLICAHNKGRCRREANHIVFYRGNSHINPCGVILLSHGVVLAFRQLSEYLGLITLSDILAWSELDGPSCCVLSMDQTDVCKKLKGFLQNIYINCYSNFKFFLLINKFSNVDNKNHCVFYFHLLNIYKGGALLGWHPRLSSSPVCVIHGTAWSMDQLDVCIMNN